ncbi:hypothetical protein [Zavarzinella formosa]|uniref:hypothetical protein n=1 Tax=Zavarzinella formosa TaxID=360055 RepID=UPI0002F2271C|nr:hypothetical protein [Zavarzinella formosa]
MSNNLKTVNEQIMQLYARDPAARRWTANHMAHVIGSSRDIVKRSAVWLTRRGEDNVILTYGDMIVLRTLSGASDPLSLKEVADLARQPQNYVSDRLAMLRDLKLAASEGDGDERWTITDRGREGLRGRIVTFR